MVIDSSGEVVPCCYWGAYGNNNKSCGNINDSILLEIWNGEAYRDLRENMANGDLAHAGCENCLALKQNGGTGLRYDPEALMESPIHTEYAKNLILLKEEISIGSNILKSLPTVISFTPSHACNFRCIHCYQDSTRDITIKREEVYEEIISLIPVLVRIVAGGGEPFILPMWRDFIKNADINNNPYLEFATSTNASIITKDIVEGLKRFKKLTINVSFDGATKEIFEKIRVNGNFEEVVANINTIIDLVKTRNSITQSSTSVTMSVMKKNIMGISDLIRFASNRGIVFGLSPVITMPVDQAINCFNNPEDEMKGWRDSIDENYLVFDNVFKGQIKNICNEVLDNYRNYISIIKDSIPWNVLEKRHSKIQGKIPNDILNAYKNQYGEDLIVAIFPITSYTPYECRYYSRIESDKYEVNLPDGEFLLGLYPRNVAPGYFADWKIKIENGEKIYDSYEISK